MAIPVDTIHLVNGEIVLWTCVASSVHIKAVTQSSDPVELNAEECRELIAALERLLATIE